MPNIWPPSADRDPNHPDSTIVDQLSSTAPVDLPDGLSLDGEFGVDVGSSWIHVVHHTEDQGTPGAPRRLHFSSFATSEINECYDFIQLHTAQINRPGDRFSPGNKVAVVAVTGSEARQFQLGLKDTLGLDARVRSEAECVARGLHFCINHMPHSIFAYTPEALIDVDPSPEAYPCLLVHIGIGVSFLKVSHDGSSERVGGSSMGIGMLTGLLSMLTGARTYEGMLENAEQGDHTNIDRLIRDIYGADYKGIGFRETDIASTFGKVFPVRSTEMVAQRAALNHVRIENNGEEGLAHSYFGLSGVGGDHGLRDNKETEFAETDISRSLLFAMSNNIGQLAFLHSQVYGARDIYFAGSYISGHRFIIRTLQAAINYWTKGQKKALFLRSDRYLGALGALQARPQAHAE